MTSGMEMKTKTKVQGPILDVSILVLDGKYDCRFYIVPDMSTQHSVIQTI